MRAAILRLRLRMTREGATGKLGYNSAFARLLVSPQIGGVRYLVDWTNSGTLGISPMPSLEPVQRIASAPVACTALDTMQSGSTRYLAAGYTGGAAGYAGGEVRLYRNTGSGWTLWDSSSTLHSGSRVVGIKVFQQGSNIYTLSADSEGNLVIARHTGSVTSVLSQASGLSSAQALAWGQDTTSTLVAVCGHLDGVPRVEVFRLTWSGTTPSLTSLAGFTVSGETGPAWDVEFVQSGSADVVVSTATRVSRWNFANNAYNRAINMADSGNIGYSTLSVAGNRVWVHTGRWTPLVNDVTTGSTIWSATSWPWDIPAQAPILALDGENAVWGYIPREASQDTSYWLVHGRGLRGGSTETQAYNVMAQGFQAFLPEAPLSIARDPLEANRFYVGGLDGTIQQVVLPRPNRIQIGHTFFTIRFGMIRDRIATFMVSWADAMVYHHGRYRGFGIRLAAVLDSRDGRVINQQMVCNPDGTDCDGGRTFGDLRFSPSGNVGYGYERLDARLTIWDANTMGLLLSSSLSSHWWPVAVDDNRVALLYLYDQGSYQIGGSTYRRYSPAIRVMQWSSSGVATEATRIMDPNTEMQGIIPPGGNPNDYMLDLRWDMNSTRRVAAVYGTHYYDPNTPSAARRRVLILHRPNASDWSNWVLREILEQGTDFPSGVYPTLIQFHPNAPNVLYVGLSNGRLRIYRLDANGNLLNRTNPDELVPTLGATGAVASMAIGNYVLNGLNYTVMVFGGPEGLSVWAGFVCQPGWLNEAHFYSAELDIQHLEVFQPAPNTKPIMVYGNASVISGAELDLAILPCPEDVNRDGVVDDSDVLDVLFAFGGEGYNRADVNCDGLVDDSDLLQVLFAFGQDC